MLYELLTDTTPFDNRKLLSGGISEMQRTIREVEPQRPSARIARGTSHREPQADNGDGASTVPNARHHAAAPSGAIARDLDWIVMKCLEKDRRRRYGAVGDLAAEIERFLRDEPVLAGPPSTVYRFNKFALRHRAALYLAGFTLFVVLAGLALAVSGYVAAEHARADAVASRDKAEKSAGDAREAAASAEAVSRFLEQILASADPREAGRSDLTVRAALDRAVEKLDAGELSRQAHTEANVRATIGRAYRELALFDQARREFERATALYRQLRIQTGPAWAAFLQQRGALFKALRDFPQAESDLRDALRIRRETEVPPGPFLTAVLNDLATVLMDQSRMDEAAVLLGEASEIAESSGGGAAAAVGEVRNNLAYVFAGLEDWPEAERLFRAAIDWNRAHLSPMHPTLATNLDNLAQVLVRRGDPVGGEAAYREALEIRHSAFGGDHPELATTLHNLGTLLWSRGDAAGAEEIVCESFEMFRRIYGLGDENTLVALNSLVSILGARGDFQRAEQYLLDAFLATETSPTVRAATRENLAKRLAELNRVRGRTEDAGKWHQRATEVRERRP